MCPFVNYLNLSPQLIILTNLVCASFSKYLQNTTHHQARGARIWQYSSLRVQTSLPAVLDIDLDLDPGDIKVSLAFLIFAFFTFIGANSFRLCRNMMYFSGSLFILTAISPINIYAQLLIYIFRFDLLFWWIITISHVKWCNFVPMILLQTFIIRFFLPEKISFIILLFGAIGFGWYHYDNSSEIRMIWAIVRWISVVICFKILTFFHPLPHIFHSTVTRLATIATDGVHLTIGHHLTILDNEDLVRVEPDNQEQMRDEITQTCDIAADKMVIEHGTNTETLRVCHTSTNTSLLNLKHQSTNTTNSVSDQSTNTCKIDQNDKSVFATVKVENRSVNTRKVRKKDQATEIGVTEQIELPGKVRLIYCILKHQLKCATISFDQLSIILTEQYDVQTDLIHILLDHAMYFIEGPFVFSYGDVDTVRAL